MKRQGWRRVGSEEIVFYEGEEIQDEPNYRADSGGIGSDSSSRVGPDWASRPHSGYDDRGIGPGADYTLRSNDMTQVQWDDSSPLAKLLASRKFLLMVMDVVTSLTLYFATKYVAPSAVEDVKVIIGLLQPVFVTLIYTIAKEDAAQTLADAVEKSKVSIQVGQ